jgi:hypothetical protein
MVVRYLIAGEESRPGRKDYWNHIFLSEKAPLKKKRLEAVKILLVIAFSFCMMVAMTRL